MGRSKMADRCPGGLMRKKYIFLGLSWTLGNPPGAPLDLLVVSNRLSLSMGLYIFLDASWALLGSQCHSYSHQAKVPHKPSRLLTAPLRSLWPERDVGAPGSIDFKQFPSPLLHVLRVNNKILKITDMMNTMSGQEGPHMPAQL